MHTNVTIAAKITWLLKNIRVIGISNRLCAISSSCLVLRNIINFRVRLHNWVEQVRICIDGVRATVASAIPFAMSRFLVRTVSKLSLMIRFSRLSGPLKFDLRDSDILPIIVDPSDIIQWRVSVVNGWDIDAERIRCATLVMWVLFIDHVVELSVSRRWVTLTDMGLMINRSFMMMGVILLVSRFNLIQETLKLLGDFLREVVRTCTCKLKDLGLGRGGDLFVASYFLLIMEHTLWSG